VESGRGAPRSPMMSSLTSATMARRRPARARAGEMAVVRGGRAGEAGRAWRARLDQRRGPASHRRARAWFWRCVWMSKVFFSGFLDAGKDPQLAARDEREAMVLQLWAGVRARIPRPRPPARVADVSGSPRSCPESGLRLPFRRQPPTLIYWCVGELLLQSAGVQDACPRACGRDRAGRRPPPPPTPTLRVMTSHFSGVVTIICVSASSFLVSCMSPVSSRTARPEWGQRRRQHGNQSTGTVLELSLSLWGGGPGYGCRRGGCGGPGYGITSPVRMAKSEGR
jgi:hypothetical protein